MNWRNSDGLMVWDSTWTKDLGPGGRKYIKSYSYKIPLQPETPQKEYLSLEKQKALENLVELLEPIDSEVAKKAVHRAKKLLRGEVSEVKKSPMSTTYKVNIPCHGYLDSLDSLRKLKGVIGMAYNSMEEQHEVFTTDISVRDYLVSGWIGVTWEEFNE